MKQFFRLVGWLLFVAGAGLAGLAYATRNGTAPLGVDVFGGGIKTPEDAMRRIIVGAVTAAVGALLLYLTRRNWRGK